MFANTCSSYDIRKFQDDHFSRMVLHAEKSMGALQRHDSLRCVCLMLRFARSIRSPVVGS